MNIEELRRVSCLLEMLDQNNEFCAAAGERQKMLIQKLKKKLV